MVHQREFRCGSKKRKSYHDKAWGTMMKEVGLYPSSTGAPGGRETGWRVSHFVVPGGPFERAVAELMDAGFKISPALRSVAAIRRRRRQKAKPSSLALLAARMLGPSRTRS
jgi:hypothetical protein